MTSYHAGMTTDRNCLRSVRRIVVKIGTRVLTHDDGTLALGRLFSLVEELAAVHRQAREVLLVSSGAVGLGREALMAATVPTDLADRQAFAAVGQSRLVNLYQQALAHKNIVVGQILLTQQDFRYPERLANLRRSLGALLTLRVLPIINENDVVATDELVITPSRQSFGDNDELSALVATHLGAELLVILSSVDGVFDKDPRQHADAGLLSLVDHPASVPADNNAAEGGRGGMGTKLRAAAMAQGKGCHVVIASGRRHGVLRSVLSGESVGSWIPARESS
jgi:glutamate 5-kinase